MMRRYYFNYIEERLDFFAFRIWQRGKLNLFDLNIHMERFFIYLFNLLYCYELVKMNVLQQDAAAIDLVDHKNRVIIRGSATCTRAKVESALGEDILKEYSGYSFKFVSIWRDTSELRKQNYDNPHSLNFNPLMDIHDINSILKAIEALDTSKIYDLYDFIGKKVARDVNIPCLSSHLISIIDILSKDQWNEPAGDATVNSFEIERKIEYSEPVEAKDRIDKYFLFYKKIAEKYEEFDRLGSNKTVSVLSTIKKVYHECKNIGDADTVFTTVIDRVKEIVMQSPNFQPMPIDELELCIDILVVDAFARCKIFRNPEGYNYVNA